MRLRVPPSCTLREVSGLAAILKEACALFTASVESSGVPQSITTDRVQNLHLDGRRDVGVGDELDLRLVDAHAEGDGGDYDHAVFGEETVLVPVADCVVHPCVVGQRRAST